MEDFIEVDEPQGVRRVALEADRASIGADPGNTIAISGDPLVSRLHAALERFPTGWVLRDLGSRNGTTLRGEPVAGEQPVRNGDEIVVGRTRLTMRCTPRSSDVQTATPPPAPDLTRREEEVLEALCSPLAGGDVFTAPATVKQIAEALVVSEASVKFHLQNLYDKFGIDERAERRVALANEAVRRGVVTPRTTRLPPGAPR